MVKDKLPDRQGATQPQAPSPSVDKHTFLDCVLCQLPPASLPLPLLTPQ